MTVILILGALFTGVGIYTVENSASYPAEEVVMRCKQVAEERIYVKTGE